MKIKHEPTFYECFDRAFLCHTTGQFKGKFYRYYTASVRNGWLDTLVKIMPTYALDFRQCYLAASKYVIKKSFERNDSRAAYYARKNGWFKYYYWMQEGIKHAAEAHVKWTFDTCYELALKCTKKSELGRLSNQAYRVAMRNGWFKHYTWFKTDEEIRHAPKPSRRKWTYDIVRNLALGYTTLAMFSKNHPSVYTVAQRNGWMTDFTWLKRNGAEYRPNKENIYTYVFPEYNCAYVGLTVNPHARDLQHRMDEKSAVFKFAASHSIPIPPMKILRSSLSATEAQGLENYYVQMYVASGWNVLNKGRTGVGTSSIGMLSEILTEEHCRRVAKSCKTLYEFRKKHASVYNKAVRMGWNKDYTWLKRMAVYTPKNSLTFEACYEAALKCKDIGEFTRNFQGHYIKACKSNWLKSLPLKPVPLDDRGSSSFRWTPSLIVEAAHLSTSLADFRSKYPSAYKKVRYTNNWELISFLPDCRRPKKKVIQLDKAGNVIATYNGAREASRSVPGTNPGALISCCNGKYKSHAGFQWKYAE